MGIIAQKQLFCWQDVENIEDLESGKPIITRLYDDYEIKPIIDIRNCWKPLNLQLNFNEVKTRMEKKQNLYQDKKI